MEESVEYQKRFMVRECFEARPHSQNRVVVLTISIQGCKLCTHVKGGELTELVHLLQAFHVLLGNL